VSPGDVSPWFVLAGLGAYHGLNPGMGWLFAVALGLQEKTRAAILRALPPIALGHAASVAGVLALARLTQALLPPPALRALSAAVILGFAASRLIRARHPRWAGMRVGTRDLAAWSFVMSSAHGAGLMLVPVLLWCGAAPAGSGLVHAAVFASLAGGVPAAAEPAFLLAAAGVHTLGLLVAAAATALLVYEWAGLGVLRRAWVNLDLIWGVALSAAGAATFVL
jgi:hypothetical protein